MHVDVTFAGRGTPVKLQFPVKFTSGWGRSDVLPHPPQEPQIATPSCQPLPQTVSRSSDPTPIVAQASRRSPTVGMDRLNATSFMRPDASEDTLVSFLPPPTLPPPMVYLVHDKPLPVPEVSQVMTYPSNINTQFAPSTSHSDSISSSSSTAPPHTYPHSAYPSSLMGPAPPYVSATLHISQFLTSGFRPYRTTPRDLPPLPKSLHHIQYSS